MPFIKAKKTSTDKIRYYEINEINNHQEAFNWIISIKNLPELSIYHIAFLDLTNRLEEGSTSIEFDQPINFNSLESEFFSRDIDLINLKVIYNDHPIVIGMNFMNYRISISTPKNLEIDYSALENLLKLI